MRVEKNSCGGSMWFHGLGYTSSFNLHPRSGGPHPELHHAPVASRPSCSPKHWHWHLEPNRPGVAVCTWGKCIRCTWLILVGGIGMVKSWKTPRMHIKYWDIWGEKLPCLRRFITVCQLAPSLQPAAAASASPEVWWLRPFSNSTSKIQKIKDH